jgi:prolipoprotein diacylglyceryl transferase
MMFSLLASVDLVGVLGSLPSPGSGSIKIGPLELRAYGLLIAVGVFVAVWIWGKRLSRAGIGGSDEATSVALWAVPAGVIGARLYHVATEWDRFSDRPGDIIKVWEGGLGIPGGMLLGIVVGIVMIRRQAMPIPTALWAVAPALPVAQAIGRWGNWFNQELFGGPTTLPWGLEVDPVKALAAGYMPDTLFHPTFLYESLWNLALAAVLVVIGRRWQNKRYPERLLAVYVLGYGIGRLWIEGLRIDPTKEGAGLRLNQWMAIVLIVAGIAYLAVRAVQARRPIEHASDIAAD